MTITSYGTPLTPFTYFKYLDRILSESENERPEVVHKFLQSPQKWARLSMVLIREGAHAWKLGIIYVAVVQVIFLYGLDTWVMTLHIRRVLGRFHRKVVCRLTGRQTIRGQDGGWVYTPAEESMAEAVLQEVENYFYRKQNTAAYFISTRPIMDLCLTSGRRPGSRSTTR